MRRNPPLKDETDYEEEIRELVTSLKGFATPLEYLLGKIERNPASLREQDYYNLRGIIGGAEIAREELKTLYKVLGDYENFMMTYGASRRR